MPLVWNIPAGGEYTYVLKVASLSEAAGLYVVNFRYEPLQNYGVPDRQADGSVGFELSMPRNLVFQIETSESLTNWTKLLTSSSTNGLYRMNIRGDQPVQFYRSVIYMPVNP